MGDSTRRDILKLLGAAGAITGAGVTGVVAQEGEGQGDGEGMVDELGEGGVDTARVRFGHLVPDGPPVDVYGYLPSFPSLGEVAIQTGLEYGAIRPNIPAEYADIPAIPLGIKVTRAGHPDETLVEVSEYEFEAGRNYTLLAAGEADSEGYDEPPVQLVDLVDNATEENSSYGRTQLPAPDETYVRFVHALPDAGTVTIRSGGETTIGGETSEGERLGWGLTFGGATNYIEVDPDEEFTVAEYGSAVARVGGDFKQGRKYTVYVVSQQPEPGGLKPFALASVDAVSRVDLDVRLV